MRKHSRCTLLALGICLAGNFYTPKAMGQVVIEESTPARARPTQRPVSTPSTPRSTATPARSRGISIEASQERSRPNTDNLNVVTTSGIRMEESTGDDRVTTTTVSESIPETIAVPAPTPVATPEPSVVTPVSTPLPESTLDAATTPTQETEPAMTEPETTKPVGSLFPLELPNAPKVKLGNEVLFENEDYTKLIRGKRVGLITNQTGLDSRMVSTIDKLANSTDWKLTALYGPEHGIRGSAHAGDIVDNDFDELTSTPVYSLYGKDKAGNPRRIPSPEVLKDVDVLVYDLQDIGNRSYTNVATLKNCMMAATSQSLPIIVLDRPNPMGGQLVDGNILEEDFESFVGWAPVAYLYGMTCGETAKWLNDKKQMGTDLTVVPMEGWKRDMKWMDTGLPWVATSTHMQRPETCWFIALTGTFGELHSVNEGVGYTAPFEFVAAPWIDEIELANELNSRTLPGLYFRPVYYKPFYGTHKTVNVSGVQIMITDFDILRPVEASMHIIEAIVKLYPDADMLKATATEKPATDRVDMFNKVMGTDQVREHLLAGKTAVELIESWKPKRDKFIEESRQFYLYD